MESKCGIQSVQMNIEGKKLTFNTTKCYVMHLGPKCAQLKMLNQPMKKYLGDIILCKGNTDNIENHRKI